MQKNQAIGIFDSGIGGLTVAKSLSEELPNEQFIYFGDTAHMPYGDKSSQEIIEYSKKIVEFLISKNVKLIVIACNSASSVAASALRAQYWRQVEIIGVIRPIIKMCIEKHLKKIGIIATKATVESHIYLDIINEYKADIEVYQKATPLLAPMIERGQQGSEALNHVLENYLQDEQFRDKEAILLACTHYPIIKQEIDDFFNHKKIILDNAKPLANEIKKYLTEKNLLADIKTKPNEFYVSRYSEVFQQTTKTFYNHTIQIIEKMV